MAIYRVQEVGEPAKVLAKATLMALFLQHMRNDKAQQVLADAEEKEVRLQIKTVKLSVQRIHENPL